MDEFVHRPKPFKSSAPKIDQILPPKPDVTKIYPQLDQLKDVPTTEEPKAAAFTIPDDGKKEPEPSDEAEDSKKDDALTDVKPETKTPKPPKKHIAKKKLILIISAAAVVLLGAGAAAYWFYFKDKPQSVVNNSGPIAEATPTPTPTPISPLTGMEVASAELAARPVTGLMIENSWAARPQSGLLEAGIVFEAIAEGGITRFLALYQEAQPQYIGPVRSIRPYYIDFAMSFDAAVGHAGGSPDALGDINSLGMKNLEAFQNGSTFFRIDERESPHNLYTSFANLDALNAAKGYTSSNFTPFVRKQDVPQTPSAAIIDFSISGYDYSAHFEYDTVINSYKRFQAGEAHTDSASGTQISPKVVIALVMSRHIMSDGSHNAYQDTGTGTMYVFQDGIASVGTWSKAERTSAFIFTDKNGLPMELNTGQTWISIVDSDTSVSYRP